MNATNHKLLLLLYILVSSFALASIPDKPKIPSVAAEVIKAVEISSTVSYPARITPKVNAVVLAETEGIVTQIETGLGQRVQKKNRLMIIKNQDPVYTYAPFSVLAPIDGAVSSVDVTIGSYVNKGQRLASITDPSKLHIQIEITASDIAHIQPGTLAKLSIPGSEGEHELKVIGVSPYLDPTTGTATGELAFLSRNIPALRPGGIGRVHFRIMPHPGLQVPESALVFRGREPFVRIIEENKAKYLSVTLGSTRQGMVEIIKGLAEGAQVITRATSYVADGDTVTIEGAPEKASE